MAQNLAAPSQPLCAFDEKHYRKIIRRIPEGSSAITASFFEWPPDDTDFPDDDNEDDKWNNVSRFFRRRIPRPSQKSLCFAATFLSQYLADTLGPTTPDSPFAFAFTGAIALLALGISNRPTSGLDIVFEGDIKAVITHLVQCSRFILPSKLVCYDYSFQFFIKVGPGQGDLSLAQDEIIYISINYIITGANPFRNRWLELTTTHHDTALNVRSLNPFSLLKNKLRTYSAYTRRRDWLDIYDIIESSANWIDLDYLDPEQVKLFFRKPPEGLTAPEEWYSVFLARKTQLAAQGSLLGLFWIP